ncbi:MAG: acyl-CoA dehydrogenase family protein [Pyrinomonadaceae bacterium MAG19_C2-C3]|nr:acyl-CoA dehydrogenase family protein [Pyrinomonadaceae bacterium MAG19_C2-C3]
MDFNLPPELIDLRERVKAFVRDEVIPLEGRSGEHEIITPEQLLMLRQKARDAGLYGLQLPKEYGGLGLGTIGMCVVFEEAGRSFPAALALNCAAPDEGNMHLLSLYANAEQRERYLRPLVEGEMRSCFAMTEPAPGAGSDPTMLKTRADKVDSGWEINGHKWFISGAQGASVAITMAVTNPNVSAHEGATMFLVPTDMPGFEIVRPISVMGSHGLGGHCEVIYRNVRVPDGTVLGRVGEAFKMSQARLAPARLTHCMRWLGVAQRSLEIATSRALEREAFGKKLSEHQAIQWMIADSEIDLHTSRMMVMHAAWKHEQGDEIRRESSICKVFVAEAINRVIDRAVQICGALGVSHDTPLADFYANARAFRIYDGASEVHRMVIARGVIKEAQAARDKVLNEGN